MPSTERCNKYPKEMGILPIIAHIDGQFTITKKSDMTLWASIMSFFVDIPIHQHSHQALFSGCGSRHEYHETPITGYCAHAARCFRSRSSTALASCSPEVMPTCLRRSFRCSPFSSAFISRMASSISVARVC